MEILLIDDEKINLVTIGDGLERAGHRVKSCASAAEALDAVKTGGFEVAVVDYKLPGPLSGLDILEEVKRSAPNTEVMIMSAHGTIDIAVNAMKMGAFDFITKPFSMDEILIKIEKLREHRELIRENTALRKEVTRRFSYSSMIGRSKQAQDVFNLIESFSGSSSSVLIVGESGTGKGLTTRVLHFNSPRRNKPLVEIHCGAIPENILESELFGHKKGSFTGAHQDREGKLAAAAGGTVVFDDIDTLPMNLQVKLLRVLQDGRFEPIGSNRTCDLTARVIATAKPSINKDSREGRFREDLFYRINTLRIELPPLRERKDDIPPLVEGFIQKFQSVTSSRVRGFEPDAMKTLMNYPFPGNIRELEHLIERILHLCKNEFVSIADLPPEIIQPGSAFVSLNLTDFEKGDRSFSAMMEDAEKTFIDWAMKKTGGNQSQAAKLLDIPRSTLQEKIKRYEIT